ncbi:uncharacterized protein HKW66_Vig0045570 [Vigna angularis]|uniref:Uncharacterized protein n=1 Tax=Phaseolus angularis TaxID=3914 RepID=A0A8T0L1B4_PHAAN|nr:uncharacterized protein HKW66_Vig0045570 [Vigna angularis]
MECDEGNLLHDKEGSHIKEKDDHGHELDDEESNSPNPVFFHMPKRKHHFNFPCIHAPDVVDDEHRFSFEVETDVPKGVVTLPKTPDYMFNIFVPGEKKSPLLSPFSVRVSNYSALDESEETGNDHVDVQAEDFIRRFYEQLRSQSPVQFLGY